MNSLEQVSPLSDDTFIYNISSNELSTEISQLSIENTFDTDSPEAYSQGTDVTDGFDSSSNLNSDVTYIVYMTQPQMIHRQEIVSKKNILIILTMKRER